MDILFSKLQKHSRVFNYFKFIKHVFSLFIDKLDYSFVKTNLIQYFYDKKLEEILVIIFKRYSKRISIGFISCLFESNEIRNLLNYSVNISSHLILFIEKTLKNKSSNLSETNKKLLLNTIFNILKIYKEKSKLITKLFSLAPYLIIYKKENQFELINDFNSILDLIYVYVQSDNLDKLRIAGLLCLDKIINKISFINKNNNFNIFNINENIKLKTLKIIFLLLNDEYSNIRKKESEIFILFNNLTQIIYLKKYYTTLINDYICQKILTKINIKKDISKKFCEFILINNFYFRVNILETKIFYIEPDNNYIDNSQNKMLILKNIFKNNMNIGSNKEIVKYNDDYKIMAVFEEFTDKIKIICNNIIKEKEENKFLSENEEDNKFIYKNIIRSKIYLLNK